MHLKLYIYILLGLPEPTVKWYKDDAELRSRPGLTISTPGGGRTSIYIQRSSESDSGQYTCIASNSAGRATSIAEVRVRGKYQWIIYL